ncbi:MAG: response regulator [Candidatus Omnitrophica bacterium]|nr:response regulator [Candidatus Omnitrophota bacterium]
MGKHIVIVDDQPDIVAITKTRLEANGYQVSSTMGARAAQDILRFKPDLILMDVMMPGADGFAVVRELKRYPDVSKVPIIIFSGKPKEAMLDLFGPEGIAGYISKPCEPEELLAQIKKTLGS